MTVVGSLFFKDGINMDLFIPILTTVCTSIFTVFGIWLTEKAQTKRKGMDIDANKEHDNYLRLESRINSLDNKVDGLTDIVSEFKAAHQQTVTMIEVLSDRVEKHNNVIERTYECERLISVHEEKIKVANHRIDDLENKPKGA